MTPTTLTFCIDLLQRVLQEGLPADQLLERAFRAHPHFGQRERSFIRDLFYDTLRHLRLLGEEPFIAHMESIVRGAHHKHHVEAWQNLSLSCAQRVSLPDWIWEDIQTQLGETEALQLGVALNQPAALDIRVNRLKCKRDTLLESFQQSGIACRPTPFSPEGIRLATRLDLNCLESYRQGWFEVQDEGSQLISHLMAVKPGWRVVDLCSGGGGKSLHLAALMHNQGAILACDTDGNRLQRQKPRLRRAGARMIQTQLLRHERDSVLRSWSGKADGVLVDAPCSGTGILRRHPEIKWRLLPEEIEALHERQCALLEAGAALVGKGGHLVYATCSLLKRENVAVVEWFLSQNRGFRLISAGKILEKFGLPGDSLFMMLYPHQSGTDGFFAALFERI
ncbi:MAG: RsmB/NOP family class I SAM-dependent RNA methyltransferase [Magnetococcus sp. DMHC-6]